MADLPIEYCVNCEQATASDRCDIHGDGMACAACGSCVQCDEEWFGDDD